MPNIYLSDVREGRTCFDLSETIQLEKRNIKIASFSKIGDGVYIGDDVVIEPGVEIGNACKLYAGVTIGLNSYIEECVVIGNNSTLSMSVSVECYRN